MEVGLFEGWGVGVRGWCIVGGGDVVEGLRGGLVLVRVRVMVRELWLFVVVDSVKEERGS